MGKTIRLITSNGKYFNISDKLVPQLPAIVRMIKESEKEECDVLELVLTLVSSTILEKIIQWATHHSNEYKVSSTKCDGENDEFDNWEISFIRQQDPESLMELILAAQYLDIKPLMNLASDRVAKLIKFNSLEKSRQMFGAEAMSILESGLKRMA